MDIREHHFGPIATELPGPDRSVAVDLGTLVRRLILFETVTIESIRLKEIPVLVGAFGAAGLRELLDSGAVRVICDAMVIGQIGQTAGLQTTIRRGGPLPLGSIRLATVSSANRRDYLHGCLQEVHKAQIPMKAAKQLKAYLASKLLEYPRGAGQAGLDDTLFDLRNRPWEMWDGVRAMVRRETDTDPGPNPGSDFSAEELTHEGDFRIITDLGTRLGLPDGVEHRCVEGGVLAVAQLNQRINLMKNFEAVTGFKDDDVALFERKAAFVWSQMNPASQEGRLDRVIAIAGLPDLSTLPAGTAIRVDHLLRLRDSDECRQLRQWVRNIDSETDEQIEAEFGSIRAKLASITGGAPGRAVRFLVTTGVGQIPLVGNIAGLALSAADSFLLDRIIGKRGPTTFLGRSYRSLFEDAGHS